MPAADSLNGRVEAMVAEGMKDYDDSGGPAASMATKLRRLERLYQQSVAAEVRASMQAISRSRGPFPAHVWEAAARWSSPCASQLQASGFVLPYLEVWGYAAASCTEWSTALDPSRPESGPQVAFTVDVSAECPGHEEHSGHTWYMIDCDVRHLSESSAPLSAEYPGLGRSSMVLRSQDRQLRWRAPRRLAHLRESLHSTVKAALGDAYSQHFGDTPFARIGAPRGTTARLAAWLSSLAGAMNSGRLTPGLVASTLSFFRGPPLEEEESDGNAEEAAVAADRDAVVAERGGDEVAPAVAPPASRGGHLAAAATELFAAVDAETAAAGTADAPDAAGADTAGIAGTATTADAWDAAGAADAYDADGAAEAWDAAGVADTVGAAGAADAADTGFGEAKQDLKLDRGDAASDDGVAFDCDAMAEALAAGAAMEAALDDTSI